MTGSVLLALLALVQATVTLAQGSSIEKLNELLAVAHYYVVSYTVWPKNNEIRICLTDDHRLAENLREVFASKSSSDRKFIVSSLSTIKSAETECGAVILSDSSAESVAILDKIQKSPVLTVSSDVDLTTRGAMVFLPQGKPPRIRLKQVNQVGLKIDSALLEISEIVQ